MRMGGGGEEYRKGEKWGKRQANKDKRWGEVTPEWTQIWHCMGDKKEGNNQIECSSSDGATNIGFNYEG